MVTKTEKLAAAEECLKELASYLSSSEDVNVETFSQEKRERFYALASKYSSFKQDPQLKGLISSLEDKYQIPAGFRTRVEEYAKRREEVLESAKKADYVDREQQKIEEREDAQATDAIKPMTAEEVLQTVEGFSKQLEYIEELSNDLKNLNRRIVEVAQKSPHNFEIAVAYFIETGNERALEEFKKSLPEDKRADFEKTAKHYQKLKESGKSIFETKNGRLVVREDAVLSDGTPAKQVARNIHKELFNKHYNTTCQHKVMVAEFERDFKDAYRNKDKLTKEQWRKAMEKHGYYPNEKLKNMGISSEVCEKYEELYVFVNGTVNDTVNAVASNRGRGAMKNLVIYPNGKLKNMGISGRLFDPIGKDARKNADSNRGNEGSGKKPLVRPQAVDGEELVEDVRMDAPSLVSPRDAKSGNAKPDVNVAKVVEVVAEANITREDVGAGTEHQLINQNASERA